MDSMDPDASRHKELTRRGIERVQNVARIYLWEIHKSTKGKPQGSNFCDEFEDIQH